MIALLLAMFMMIADLDHPKGPTGTIQGVVLNGTRDGEPIADAEVTLRAGPNGPLTPVETTTTDIYGKFRFRDLPLSPTVVYLPGADRDGVHYPGRRVQLDADNRIAHVRIIAFDAVAAPSPLAASRHEIDVEVKEHSLEIVETIVVSNPSQRTYVGEPRGNMPPITLRLSIPENFDRVTFNREFFGRRFHVMDHRVATDLPWPPGDAGIQFSYRLPIAESNGLFRRPLDLPSSNVRVRVRNADRQRVTCNLSPPALADEFTTFAPADTLLPAGYVIEVQIGGLPFEWARYLRWAAFVALCALLLGTLMVGRRQGQSANHALPHDEAKRAPQCRPAPRRRAA